MSETEFVEWENERRDYKSQLAIANEKIKELQEPNGYDNDGNPIKYKIK